MGFLEERDLSNAPTIPEFYEGKTIFITGGSGFIGKVLIEKLLYSCSGLDRIYLLLRPKKGVSSEDRLDKIYTLNCFDRLRAEKPDIFKSKVFVIAGDVSEPGLGLSEEDRALLLNRVNVVFHVAASVRFDDTLINAAKLNLSGTKEMIDLAKGMRHLSSFVHVSTSYSNTNRDPIEEVMYPPHADWRETLQVCKNVDEHTLKVLTPKFLGELPNTYTFTKQLAEHVVYEQRGQLPVVIIRPSIVVASIEEPVPGWVENFNGPVGIMVACGKGIMRSVHTRADITSDFITVDLCAKHMIAASWIRGVQSLQPADDIPIYNCCNGKLQRVTMEFLVQMAHAAGRRVPLDGALWTTGGHITSNATLHYFKVLLTHLLPAIFVDMVLKLLGKKPLLVRIQRRIYTANLALQYYLTQQWTFDNKNFVALRSALKPEDKSQFYYDLENVDVKAYFFLLPSAARKYLLKEKDEDIPKARAHLKRLNILDRIIRILFYTFLIHWMWTVIIKYYGDVLYEAFVL